MFIHRKTDLSARFIGEMTDTVLPSGKLLCVDTDTALWDVSSGTPFCGELTPVGKRSVHVFMRQKKKKRKKSIRFIFAGYKQPSQ